MITLSTAGTSVTISASSGAVRTCSRCTTSGQCLKTTTDIPLLDSMSKFLQKNRKRRIIYLFGEQ